MVVLEGVFKKFQGFTLGPLNLEIPQGSFFMLMGPTGSGKTLLLETIAGLCVPDSGRVFSKGADITLEKPGKRDVGIVYQDSALFPHMTVRQNLEYGLRWNPPGKVTVDRLADMLDLGRIMHRFPGRLSGGEKQRTALARALATGPSVILLDEPMSSLDPHFRGNLRREIREIHRTTGTTFVMATHDFSDSLSLGTSGAVVNKGKIEQQGEIDEIFFRPGSPFMASFVGMKNVLPVTFGTGQAVTGNGLKVALNSQAPSGRGHIAVSPDSIALSRGRSSELSSVRNRFTGVAVEISRDGYGFLVGVECCGHVFYSSITPASLELLKLREGMEVTLSWKASSVHIF